MVRLGAASLSIVDEKELWKTGSPRSNPSIFYLLKSGGEGSHRDAKLDIALHLICRWFPCRGVPRPGFTPVQKLSGYVVTRAVISTNF